MNGWHFAPNNGHLNHTPPTEETRIIAGRTFTIPNPSELDVCRVGLHACPRIIDALYYAPGCTISRVALGGRTERQDDKAAGTTRTHDRVLPASVGEGVLRDFARRCALDVIHLWDAPDVVVRYLRTGDENLRAAAWGAALGAAKAAAGAAARAAALDAAWAATWGAALGAAKAAAKAAAEAAAGAAARAAQNRRLTSMVVAAMRKHEAGAA